MQGYTFSEISRKWLENAVIGVSFSWDEELKSIVGHLNKALGKKKIDDIKASDIEFLIKTLSVKNPNTNKPSSKRFLKCISNVSNSIFDFAIDNKYASGNPACKSARKIPKSAPTKIVDAVNDKQKNLIIEYEHSTKIAAIIMMFMGLRTGELLALEWKDIDFDEKVVHINKKCSRCSSNQFIVKQGTKNGKNRTVPIPSLIADWLEEKLLDSTNSLIIPNKSGCLHTPTTWRRTWESYQCDLNYYAYVRRCKTKGITPKNKFAPTGIPDMGIKFNAHQLRHTYATMLYLSEVDVLTAKELLGHCDIKTTLGIYTHLEEKYKKLNIIKFDQYIQSELLNAASL